MTKEELQQKLIEISKLREQKGREDETLAEVEKLKQMVGDNFVEQARLYWEEGLTYQHLVMSHVDEEINREKMAQAAMKAHEVVEKNKLDNLLGDDYRFLGRVADYNGKYEEAKNWYEKAIEFYKGQPRELEIKSFLSATLIYLGKNEEGISLAKSTFDEFLTNPLREKDYYTWAVWVTGIWPRMVKAMKEKGVEIDKSEVLAYLDQSDKFLFRYRIDEIEEARKLLN